MYARRRWGTAARNHPVFLQRFRYTTWFVQPVLGRDDDHRYWFSATVCGREYFAVPGFAFGELSASFWRRFIRRTYRRSLRGRNHLQHARNRDDDVELSTDGPNRGHPLQFCALGKPHQRR